MPTSAGLRNSELRDLDLKTSRSLPARQFESWQDSVFKINPSFSSVVILSMGRAFRYIGTNTCYQVQKNLLQRILVSEQ